MISQQNPAPSVCKMKLLVALMMLVNASSLIADQGETPTCESTFFSALVQLIPCRAAVSPFSPIPPSEACCDAVKSLGQTCLCVLVNGPPISGVDRDMTLLLPEKCATHFEPCDIMKQKIKP